MNQLNRRRILLGLGGLPLVLAGCGGGNSGGDTAAPATGGGNQVTFAAKASVDNIADAIIVQTYTNLDNKAGELLAAVQALAADPTNDALLDAAQTAWRAARVPWESSEGFLFGPVDSLSIDPALDSWPLNTSDLQAFLGSNPNATQANIEAAGDDVRGFHAMEYLLFGDGVSDNDKQASELTTAEANYLIALAQAFKAKTDGLKTSWTGDFNSTGPYATTLKTPGAGKAYTGYAAVFEELIGGLAGIADEVGNAKMSEPLGAALADADTSKVESQYSWNSLTDFHNNLQSVLNVYTGKLGFSWITDTVSVSQNGLYAFVHAHGAELADRVLNEIVDAQKKIALIKGDGDNMTTIITGAAKPFRQQILADDGRALIATAIAACNTLQATLENDVQPIVEMTTFTA